jgi:hypothetical protein
MKIIQIFIFIFQLDNPQAEYIWYEAFPLQTKSHSPDNNFLSKKDSP